MKLISVKERLIAFNNKIERTPKLKKLIHETCPKSSILQIHQLFSVIMRDYYYHVSGDRIKSKIFQHEVLVSCQVQLPTVFWIEFKLVHGELPYSAFSSQVNELEGLELGFGKDTVWCLKDLNGIEVPFLFDFTL